MDRKTAIRLLHLAAPFKWWMLLSALLGFLTIGSSIGLMTAAAWIVASAALHPPIATLDVAIVGVRFFGITRGVFRYLERYVSHQTTFRLLARLRVWFYEQIEPLAPARLMQVRSGDLLTRAVNDINTLENFYLRVIAPPAVALMVGGVMVVFMAYYDVRLALALIACLVLAGIGVPLLTSALSRQAGRAIITTRADLNVALIDGVQGLADLLAYGAQHRQVEQVRQLNRMLQRHQARMAAIAGLSTALISLLTSAAAILTLVIAIPLVHGGGLDGVILAVLVLAALTSFEAVQPLPAAYQYLSSNLEAARRLFELVGKESGAHSVGAYCNTPLSGAACCAPTTISHPPIQRVDQIAVQNLKFRYGPGEPLALDGVSFTLGVGKMLAVVGASGAGKSTLVNVLLRFWDYESGEIRLDGRDLRDYTPEEVRAQMSVVSQNTYLFNDTIRANLRIATADASEDDLIQAAQAAQLHTFIESLPQGYDTWIGEQGLRLSGGERQRLALARAILKDAPIMILDEATANLDTLTERATLHTIYTMLAGRTTLMITHRLIGLEAADEILVLHEGCMVERGRHGDLLQIDGAYRRMWNQQQQAFDPA
jgi:ATP-binding cassette subfamily C protein CydC